MDNLQAEAARLLKAESRIYIASTGAGAGLQKLLWDVPGISKVLIGAEFPYAEEALDRFLGYAPERYCAVETAVAMAMEAYYRAYKPGGAPAVGLGMAGSVASVTAHRGDHRVFVAMVNDRTVRTNSAVLEKGTGTERRQLDGELADAMGLLALLGGTGVFASPDGPLLQGFRSQPTGPGWFKRYEADGGELIAHRLINQRPMFTATGKRLPMPTSGNGLTLFPGAFNPPHQGHMWLATEHGATFHVTVNPPHKPSLSVAEILQRAKLLEGYGRMFTTDDPLYLDKARRFPGARFIVGSDAMVRMLDPKWGPDPAAMMEEFRQLGVRFLVADREQDGRLVGLDDIPGAPRDICTRVLRPAQHLGLSSTKVRQAMAESPPVP